MMADSGGRLRRLAQGTSRQHLTLAGSAAGAAVLAVLVAGGFDPSETTAAEELAPLAAGDTVDVGPFVVTIDRMRVVDELPGVSEGDDETRVLAVVATVEATGTKTQHGYLLNESLALAGVPGVPSYESPGRTRDPDEPVPAEGAYVMADGTVLDAVQPGLEYEVALVWEQDARADVPAAARLVLVGHTLRQSSIDHTDEWLDPLPVAAGDLEVTAPEPDEPAESPSGGGS
ncbi:hypothetical protein E1212_13430 [Jiangella ureilytica]|uniref:Uncharacterized protein n=1 Tax=Jiangella ureilytica TaxID=2530374 RepID=A0A4R4RMS9_9ACTN|nr:hypothetical protein [Jiangella ureilytica]TDC50940.1 hypothetical protein E1212_13430 [Jiangella ureilytica]